MRKNNTAIIFGSLFFSCSVMAANGTLAPTVVPMVNGGQASIAISNTSPNLFTVPGDRIIAVNSLDGALTNNEQTASGGVVVTGWYQCNASDCSGTTGNGPGGIEQSRKRPAWVQQQYCQCLELAQSVWF